MRQGLYGFLSCALGLAASLRTDQTFYNPILPGWNPDPSCIFVPEANNTFFCTTSSLVVFPALPIYASQDLQSWELISNVLHDPDQFPDIASASIPNEGFLESTLRYHHGKYYLTTGYYAPDGKFTTLIFKSHNPFNESGWGKPLECPTLGYDPDLFWDDDGSSYLTALKVPDNTVIQAPIDLDTGRWGSEYYLWNGTGGGTLEGPHIIKKDGFYYLTIAEGGISVDHMQTMARSERLNGPYIPFEKNPVLSSRNSSEYFQAVGHLDLFQDAKGEWFGVACATRSGPEWKNFPMGRETSLFPVTWNQGQWPEFPPVRGVMNGSSLPPRMSLLKDEDKVDGTDMIDFSPGSSIPKHLLHYGLPNFSSYTVSPKNYSHSLRLRASKTNLTGTIGSKTAEQRTAIFRKQAHSLFSFELDILFTPAMTSEEAGITVFLAPQQHLDLAIGSVKNEKGSVIPALIFRVMNLGKNGTNHPPTEFYPLPEAWRQSPVRLQVSATNVTTYRFSANLISAERKMEYVFYGSAGVVTAGEGKFDGALFWHACTKPSWRGRFEMLMKSKRILAWSVCHYRWWKWYT
ncbi:unnamed protein product [Penicillium olsonii]|nr:unnamed protein product [Penicillium olsonii]